MVMEADVNVSVVEGAVVGEVGLRVLRDGSEVLELDVAPADGGRAVPVVMRAPTARHRRLEVGASVLVVGRVQRRFYRGAGGVRSATEIVADEVVRAPGSARARALGLALERLGGP